MELNSLYRKSKRGRSESISGRLRAASDLEEIGWIDKNQKGVIKDLIISGDETLRSALDKYENGDAHDLEALITGGMLTHRPSLDLLDGLDLDFLSVGYNGNEMLPDGGVGEGFYEDDFLFDQSFDGTNAEDEAYHSDVFKLGLADNRNDPNWAIQFRRSSLGSGSLDLTGCFFEGLGAPMLPSSRKHSLSLPPVPRHTPLGGLGLGLGLGLDDVDMSAYQNMAASLQAQTEAHQREKKNLKSPSRDLSATDAKRNFSKKKENNAKAVSIKSETHSPSGPDKTSAVLAPHLQIVRNRPAGTGTSTGTPAHAPLDSANTYHQSADVPVSTHQQIGHQQNSIVRQSQQQFVQQQQQQARSAAKVKESFSPIQPSSTRMVSIPEGTEERDRDRDSTHGHTHINTHTQPRDREHSILRSLYNQDGTLCDTASIPLGGRGYIGAYSPEARRERIERFLAKRDKRVWTKKVKYDVRKNFADSRLRVKGRFVKKADEELMKELLSI